MREVNLQILKFAVQQEQRAWVEERRRQLKEALL